MNIYFFLSWDFLLNTIMRSDTTVVSIAALFFHSCSSSIINWGYQDNFKSVFCFFTKRFHTHKKALNASRLEIVLITSIYYTTYSYYSSYTWSKNIHWQLSKIILSGIYNCNFEAINYVLNNRMKKLEMKYVPFICTIIFWYSV